MESTLDQFKTLFARFEHCQKCQQTIPEIASLTDQEFKFQWLPCLRGPLPLRYVFLGWEPSFYERWEEVDEGTFSEPLQFAIREFLLEGKQDAGFLITNMAQCSMRTGSICNATREARFQACSEFLKQQLLLAGADKGGVCIVSIGQHPKEFIERHPALYASFVSNSTIHRISHYSQAGYPHFYSFARNNSREFEAFADEFRPKYEHFIQNGEYRNHWQWYAKSPDNARGDLERIFKWRSEMRDFVRAEG